MASNYTTKKIFTNFKGLDLRDSDLIRPEQYASEILNTEYRETGAISKRKGYHAKAISQGGSGLAVYSEPNPVNGAVENQLVSISDKLHLLNQHTLDITYTGTELAYVTMQLSPITETFKFEVFENSSTLLSVDLGKGRDDLSALPISSLLSSINALTDFSASVTGIDSVPAAFLDISRQISLNDPVSIGYSYYTEITSPTGTPFSAHYARRGEKDFENASTANLNGVLYISNGYDELHKYDGDAVYRAGMPTPADISGAISGTGLTGTYKYRITYEYTDAKDNFVEGIPSNELEVTLSNEGYEITYENLLAASGFNVDDPDLKINIWRTDDAGQTTFFLIGSVANDSGSATSTFLDNGIALGAQYIEPLQPAGLPPKAKYITTYRNRLILTGKVDDVNNTFYSTLDYGGEAFPPADNAFLTDNSRGDANTGIAALGNILYVFKSQSIYALTGDLESGRFRVDLVTRGDIGCVAHATIKEVNNRLYYLANNGVYAIAGVDQEPAQISEIIEPVFSLSRRKYCENKATAVNWLSEDKYILVLPEISKTDGYVTIGTEIVVHDYFRGAWLLWDKLDGSAGIEILNGQCYFTERRNSISEQNYVYRVSNTGDTWDYADHDEEVRARYATHWEALQEPSTFKKYLRLKVHSLDTAVNDFETDGFLLDVTIESDYIRNNPTSQFTLDFGQGSATGYGNQPWGNFPWGNSRFSADKAKIKQTKARSQRIIFENNTLHENILISGYEVEMATPYRVAIKE